MTDAVSADFPGLGEASGALSNGSVRLALPLPGVNILGSEVTPRLRYSSATALPRACFRARMSASGAIAPVTYSLSMAWSFLGRSDEVHAWPVSGAPVFLQQCLEARDPTNAFAKTGVYPYRLNLTYNLIGLWYATANQFGGPPLADTGVVTDELVRLQFFRGRFFTVVNHRDSPFGAGWSLDGLSRLFATPDGGYVVIDADRVTRIGGGRVMTVVRTAAGQALQTGRGVASDRAGGIDFSGGAYHRIGAQVFRLSPEGVLEHVAGRRWDEPGLGIPALDEDGVPALQAGLNASGSGLGLSVGDRNDLFIADTGNHLIRRVD